MDHVLQTLIIFDFPSAAMKRPRASSYLNRSPSGGQRLGLQRLIFHIELVVLPRNESSNPMRLVDYRTTADKILAQIGGKLR